MEHNFAGFSASHVGRLMYFSLHAHAELPLYFHTHNLPNETKISLDLEMDFEMRQFTPLLPMAQQFYDAEWPRA